MTGLLLKAELAKIGGQIKTVGVARAAIGRATEMLHAAYDRAEDLTDSADLHDTAVSYLNQANAYAGKVYAELPATDLARALTVKEQARVAEVVREAGEALETINDALQETAFDFPAAMYEVLARVGGAAGNALNLGGQGILILLWSFVRQSWWVLAIVLVVVVAIRRGALLAARKAIAP